MLDGKIVCVTGASSGIGQRTAQLLYDKGAQLVCLARSIESLEGTIRPMEGALCYAMDVTDHEQVQETFQQIIHKFGRIDILINNAGMGHFVSFEETDMAQFKAMMEVNYFGMIHCIQAVLPSMLERGQGHIINVASLAGKVATAKASGYAASKHAVLGLTQSLRHELRGKGIAVSAVNPGPVATPFLNKADPTGNYFSSLGRTIIQPERVAQAIFNVIQSRKPEINLPMSLALGAALYRAFPRLLDGVAYRLINKK